MPVLQSFEVRRQDAAFLRRDMSRQSKAATRRSAPKYAKGHGPIKPSFRERPATTTRHTLMRRPLAILEAVIVEQSSIYRIPTDVGILQGIAIGPEFRIRATNGKAIGQQTVVGLGTQAANRRCEFG
jgi:hypothetical protein